ncbi:hypothetical protein PHYBOEH_000343 [Phytophthora boehmeriae]|uniref:Succinylglutamate desuccinylase/Aspartoacylase catalytic domain-containing protein n=1 Tax=Phytophthora boehmeriae TaxID=109152 RepID=A0A8T1VEB8_9STRA|nr:hypothetical protein PHYBOEH_000343 [Phytophthora boehmeriae]
MGRAVNTFTELCEGVYRFTRGGGSLSSGGPNVTLVGGVHGNERIGAVVLDALRLALQNEAPLSAANGLFPLISRGSLTLVYGNPKALKLGTRGSEPHADLNRCFPRDLLTVEPDETFSYEQLRAKELAPIFASSDLLVDIHSTNKASPPFVRLAGHEKVPPQLLRISDRFPTRILLLDPKYLIGDGKVALTDEFVGVNGGMGICYESGLASDMSQEKVDNIMRTVLQILQLDMQSIEFMDASGEITTSDSTVEKGESGVDQSERDVYEITEVFKLTSQGFRWADGVGEENFQRVPAGQTIGFVSSEPFKVNYDSHIVFPKIPSLWKIDA